MSILSSARSTGRVQKRRIYRHEPIPSPPINYSAFGADSTSEDMMSRAGSSRFHSTTQSLSRQYIRDMVSMTPEDKMSRWHAEYMSESEERESTVPSLVRARALRDLGERRVNMDNSSDDEISTSSDARTESDMAEPNAEFSRRENDRAREESRNAAQKRRQQERQRDEDAVVETEDVTKSADRLIPLFLKPWDGCGRDKHNRELQIHTVGNGEDHHWLDATFDRGRQATGYKDRVGLSRPSFASESDTNRNAFPAGGILQESFEGTNCENSPPTICLHVEHEAVESHIPYDSKDTDSLIFIPSTLAALRKQFMMCAVYDVSRNIKNSLHQPINVRVLDEYGVETPEALEFRDLPHTYLGYMDGISNIVMLAFPRLYSVEKTNNYLTKKHVAQLYEQVIRPAIISFVDPGHLTYIPRTQELADTDAYAQSREARVRDASRKKMSHFPIPPNKNGSVWDEMMRIINASPALDHFKDCVLLVDIKNIKSQTSDLNLYRSMDRMDDLIEDLFNQAHIPEQYNLRDLGAIVAPRSPEAHPEAHSRSKPAITYQWRRCCTEHFVQGLVNDGFDGTQPASSMIFTVAHLRDACCLYLVPPENCYLFRGGLRFVQQYGCSKTLFDAMGLYPFSGDHVNDVCVDNAVWKTAATMTKSLGARKRASGFNEWSQSKERVIKSLTCEERVSHGIRLELRITRNLWVAIKRRARQYYEELNSPEVLYDDEPPEAAWAIYTEHFTQYLYGIYDKYISLLEICVLNTPLTGRSINRMRLMRVLVACIQEFPNSYLPKQTALWVGKREKDDRREYGLGFKQTLQKYGFAWIMPGLIKWDKIEFHGKVGGAIAGSINRRILPWCPNIEELVAEQMGGKEDCIAYLKTCLRGGELEKEVLLILAHQLLRQYRGEVLNRLKNAKAIKTDAIHMVQDDGIKFSWDGLTAALIEDLNPVGGQKMIAHSPKEMFAWLWQDTPGHDRGCQRYQYNRLNWDNAAYRMSFQDMKKFMQQLDPTDCVWDRFKEVLFTQFFKYHWAIPYPSPNGAFVSVTKSPKKRQIWNVGIEGNRNLTFYFNNKLHKQGLPPDYPAVCYLQDRELRKHLRDLSAKDYEVEMEKERRREADN